MSFRRPFGTWRKECSCAKIGQNPPTRCCSGYNWARIHCLWLSCSQCSAELRKRQENLYLVALGGTATGTGANTHPQYKRLVVAELAKFTGFPLKPAGDNFEALQSHRRAQTVSSGLKGSGAGTYTNSQRLEAISFWTNNGHKRNHLAISATWVINYARKSKPCNGRVP